jgi:uncharacterized protein (UPF0218 family)
LPLYRINEKTRTRLKHPFGQLLVGPPEKTTPWLARIIAEEVPRKVIAVGDAVSLWTRRYGIDVSIYVIDRKMLRADVDGNIAGLSEVFVRNPPGEITEEAYEGLRKALAGSEAKVVRVEGEEDLLALPSVVLAPVGSMVVYGQPHVGVVVVRVTPEVKDEVRELLDAMRVSGSGKG